jgi:hypothetical protein
MNKKVYTFLFTLISTLANIILTVGIILVLIILSTLLLSKCFSLDISTHQNIYLPVWMVCALIGMVLGMFLFAKISGVVIVKYNLEKKLDTRLLGKNIPGTNRTVQSDDEEPKKKTVMPSSVLPKKDEWADDVYAGTSDTSDATSEAETEILSEETLKKK